jgi:hypothetical protein
LALLLLSKSLSTMNQTYDIKYTFSDALHYTQQHLNIYLHKQHVSTQFNKGDQS